MMEGCCERVGDIDKIFKKWGGGHSAENKMFLKLKNNKNQSHPMPIILVP